MPLAATGPESPARIAAFTKALEELGWTGGHNIQINIRWGAGDAELIRKYAAELVALAPDVILCGGIANVGPLQQAIRAVPIVFVVREQAAQSSKGPNVRS
jgi:ABC-type uncharacterized transport system substrate-binding protein